VAHTLSALYFPEGVDAAFVGRVRAEGVVLAGGLHPDAKAKYFRVGHMGAVAADDVVTTVAAIERALVASGHAIELGAAVGAAQSVLTGR
jgi:alanine-glyoxylate transaminase/serine-glyoxylate transaminase/serine-pyruvate transaminase